MLINIIKNYNFFTNYLIKRIGKSTLLCLLTVTSRITGEEYTAKDLNKVYRDFLELITKLRN
jgi:hypothetical protein